MEGPSAEDVAYLKAVFDGLVDAWVRWGRPEPASVSRARGILDRALTTLTCALSADGQGSDCRGEELESSEDVIGTAELAELYGVTRRTAQRRAEAMGAQRVSGAYVLRKDDLADIGADLDGS
jgi:hypothetical protein